MPRAIRVTPEEYFRRMLWFWDPHTKCYPFARHPRYKYMAYSLTARRRSYEKAKVFVSRELPAGTTREQVQWQLQNENDFTINKLNGRAGQIKGTAAYWCAQKSQANCWVLNGVVEHSSLPHIFMTTSEPELHDPVLHRLLDQINLDPSTTLSTLTDLEHRKLCVRDNLHVVTQVISCPAHNKMCSIAAAVKTAAVVTATVIAAGIAAAVVAATVIAPGLAAAVVAAAVTATVIAAADAVAE